MKRIRPHLTYANVMSTIAVFLVLGGATAFAVSKALPKKSVGAKQLKPGAVTYSKIGRNAVRTLKIKDDAVTGDKLNEATLGTVPSAATAEGPVAFAHVSAAGTLLDGQGVTVTKGDSSTKGQPFYYCFSGLPFAPRGLVASPDYRNETLHFNTTLQVGLESSGGLGGTGCAAGTQAYVHGVEASTNAQSSVAFYIVFFK